MTQVTITYNLNGVQANKQGEQVGQLAVVRAHYLAPHSQAWRVTTMERYDLIHVKSSLRIDTLECSYLEALKIAQMLTSFDFDLFYENTKQGLRDEFFVQEVQFAIAQATMAV